MARRFNKRETQLHDVSYPGYPKRTLHIIIDNYQRARQGDQKMQRFLVRQYMAQAGVPEGVYLEWGKLSLRPVGTVQPPTPEVKKPNANVRRGGQAAGWASYGCTCDGPSCGPCDISRHQNCRYGCRYGQPVRR